MLSLRHSIGNGAPLESLARNSKSVPHFRCYASPPRTEIYALCREGQTHGTVWGATMHLCRPWVNCLCASQRKPYQLHVSRPSPSRVSSATTTLMLEGSFVYHPSHPFPA